MNYLLHLLVMAMLVLILIYSLNLTLGYGGILSFCQTIFSGTGAYTYALAVSGTPDNPLTHQLYLIAHWQAAAGYVAAMVMASLMGLIIGFLIVRFRGDFLVFITLAAQMVWTVAIQNATGITNGVFGITGIPKPAIFSWHLNTPADFCILMVGVTSIVMTLIVYLCRSPFGKSLIALRDDALAAQSFGISVNVQFVSAFTISAMFSGLAGAIFTSYIGYLNPNFFDLNGSIFLVTILLLGGSGNLLAPLAGVTFMLLVPEVFRLFHFAYNSEFAVRQILFGSSLVLLMYFRPEGIAGSYQIK